MATLSLTPKEAGQLRLIQALDGRDVIGELARIGGGLKVHLPPQGASAPQQPRKSYLVRRSVSGDKNV